MKILIFLIYSATALCCEVSSWNACRDNPSVNTDVSHNFAKYLEVYKRVTPDTEARVFFNTILKLRGLSHCQNKDKISSCGKKAIRQAIRDLYHSNQIDSTALKILEANLNSAPFSISSYSNKIKRLSRLRSRRQNNIETKSPFVQKNKLKLSDQLKKLSQRDYTLIKYNYSQLRAMDKLLKKFDERLSTEAIAGIYFDMNKDGEIDEQIEFDPATQYCFTARLLKLELEKLSRSGEVFAGKAPSWADLLVASSELGSFDDSVMEQLLVLPGLKKEQKRVWKQVGDISWTIGKSVVMAIPGVNLYAIIPIVLIESLDKAKEAQDEKSSLHLCRL